MKEYKTQIIEVVTFENEDVIQVSLPGDNW